MNMNHGIAPKLQYQYLLHTVRPMKRKFEKWQKATSIQDIEWVKEYFSYSNQKAKEAMRILSNEDLQLIKNKLDRGGVKSQNTK
jgi:predicted DNA binding CopG/RHH family protein